MKWFKRIGALLLIVLIAYAAWIKIRSLIYEDGGPPLAIRWEGFYHDMNARDVGASLNQCLGENLFNEDILVRSAGWFSGWSCDKVGEPDIIYSLNYSPSNQERFFCQSQNQKVIGRYFNPEIQFKDLEFIETWKDSSVSVPACRFLKDMFVSILDDKKLLVHCDAGRDRTGTVSAMMVALAAESIGRLDESMKVAIECDYRKTGSLSEDKFGRMASFIQQLENQGGVSAFLQQTCQIDSSVLALVASKLVQ